MAAASTPIDPDAILNQSFEMVRRGYDPLAVQKYLMALAGELRSSRDAQRELERRVADAERRAAELEDMTPSRLTSLLGEETMRVLDAANVAAADIRSNAEESVARLLRDAQDQASELRREAEVVLARRTDEANEAADVIARQIEELRQQARVEAAAEVEAGRQEGREMVAEAQRVRERMLRDLARRRKAIRHQIDQLQAGRDRLLAAFDVVRETVDVATGELEVVLPEAKAAAEAAQRAGDDERSGETLDQDFAELAEELDALDAPADADGGPITQPVDVVVVDDGEATDGAEPGAPEPDPEVEPEVEPAAEATPEAGEPAVDEAAVDEAAVEETTESDDGEPDDSADDGEASGTVVEAAEPVETGAVGEGPEVIGVEAEVVVAEVDVEAQAEATGPGPEPEAEDEAAAVGEAPSVAKADSIFARIKNQVMLPDTDTDTDEVPGDQASSAVEPDDVTVDEVVEVEVVEVVEVEVVEVDEVEVSDGPAEPADPVEALLARRDAAVVELERNLARRIKRELSDEQNELLDTVRRGAGDADALLAAPEAHIERYASVATVILTDAAAAGSAFSGRTGRRGARPPVTDLAEELAAELVSPLRERLARGFSASNGDADEISERVRACFREWKTQRVDGVASHAVLAAFNRGLYESATRGTKVHWVVDDGDTPSPDCEDNALAGNLVKGEAFPTGHLTPPAHPTCRCLVVLVDS